MLPYIPKEISKIAKKLQIGRRMGAVNTARFSAASPSCNDGTERMPKSESKSFGFRLNPVEQAAVAKKAGALSIGEYARRLALNAQADAMLDVRRAVGRAISGIHAAVRDGLPEQTREHAVRLLEDALLELHQADTIWSPTIRDPSE